MAPSRGKQFPSLVCQAKLTQIPSRQFLFYSMCLWLWKMPSNHNLQMCLRVFFLFQDGIEVMVEDTSKKFIRLEEMQKPRITQPLSRALTTSPATRGTSHIHSRKLSKRLVQLLSRLIVAIVMGSSQPLTFLRTNQF